MRTARILTILLLGVLAATAAETSEEFLRRIEDSIRSEPRLRVYDWVQYQVDGAQVTLTGFVSLPSLRDTLEDLVRRVEGVEEVVNQLDSVPLSRDDMGIRVNAYWRIYGNAELRRYAKEEKVRTGIRRQSDDVQRVLLRRIHIVVRNGHLTLEGEVEQNRDIKVAADAANQVMGIRSVTNNLAVDPGNTEERQALRTDDDAWWKDVSTARMPGLRVDNPSGLVKVQVVATERLRFRKSSPDREVEDGDVVLDQLQRKMRLTARPQDGARIDLDIDLPYGHRLEVETVDGPIELSGLVRRAELRTGTGRIRLASPWDTVRLEVRSRERPEDITVPAGLFQPDRVVADRPYGSIWLLADGRPADAALYGEVKIVANRPEQLWIETADVPLDSPVRMHWEAPRVLEAIFRPDEARRLQNRDTLLGAPLKPAGFDQESVHFSSEVRLVDLTVAAVDSINRPIADLTAADFEVVEEGVPQTVRIVDGEQTSFNLVVLLDCSTSTLTERFTVVQAAKQFVAVARPQDRVAVYVLADGYLQVLSRLTNDREELLRRIEDIPPLSGSTPLYDAITLSYAQELAGRRWERNALIIISDGMDNQLLPPVGRIMPSKVPFADLKRAAAEMNAVIYPIYLDAPEAPRTELVTRQRGLRERARTQLEELAEAAGGRVFRAPSIRSLKHVYEEVADELRSVYRIGYYPLNQDFDGAWRQVEVKVRRRGSFARTRPGYYAW